MAKNFVSPKPTGGGLLNLRVRESQIKRLVAYGEKIGVPWKLIVDRILQQVKPLATPLPAAPAKRGHSSSDPALTVTTYLADDHFDQYKAAVRSRGGNASVMLESLIDQFLSGTLTVDLAPRPVKRTANPMRGLAEELAAIKVGLADGKPPKSWRRGGAK